MCLSAWATIWAWENCNTSYSAGEVVSCHDWFGKEFAVRSSNMLTSCDPTTRLLGEQWGSSTPRASGHTDKDARSNSRVLIAATPAIRTPNTGRRTVNKSPYLKMEYHSAAWMKKVTINVSEMNRVKVTCPRKHASWVCLYKVQIHITLNHNILEGIDIGITVNKKGMKKRKMQVNGNLYGSGQREPPQGASWVLAFLILSQMVLSGGYFSF